ncbi:hypothetical protein [Syntrophomonas palmitatica]|nr:hypothetical protein [Syntrophomonas palmitatica]
MFKLDFAFFNIMNYDRRGLLFQKVILERLAPVFCSPGGKIN